MRPLRSASVKVGQSRPGAVRAVHAPGHATGALLKCCCLLGLSGAPLTPPGRIRHRLAPRGAANSKGRQRRRRVARIRPGFAERQAHTPSPSSGIPASAHECQAIRAFIQQRTHANINLLDRVPMAGRFRRGVVGARSPQRELISLRVIRGPGDSSARPAGSGRITVAVAVTAGTVVRKPSSATCDRGFDPGQKW